MSRKPAYPPSSNTGAPIIPLREANVDAAALYAAFDALSPAATSTPESLYVVIMEVYRGDPLTEIHGVCGGCVGCGGCGVQALLYCGLWELRNLRNLRKPRNLLPPDCRH